MAGDWIKMRSDLFTHPKVVRIVSALKADKLRVVGGLNAVWCLFDAHSVDGELDGYTTDALDDHIGWLGFSAQMVRVGWLVENAESLTTPRFDEHNGQSAKRRATETVRKRLGRAAPEMSAGDADKLRSREEKRREEKTPKAPAALETRFDRFWSAYPKKVGKDAAFKAFEKRKPCDELTGQMVAAIFDQSNSQAWTKDRGQFIPNPATWLNEGRWKDEQQEAAETSGLLAGAI